MSRVDALSVKPDILLLASGVICVLKVSHAVVYAMLGLGNVLNVWISDHECKRCSVLLLRCQGVPPRLQVVYIVSVRHF